MSRKLTVDDARQSLTGHVALKGGQLREKYGPHIGWNELMKILDDREFVRYPCKISFDAAPLVDGEFACPIAKSEKPEDGFTMYVHPFFGTQLPRAVWLVLYQLVVVNYGEFASSEDAETFGSAVLGISKDEYYHALCEMADSID